ncbi:hypothetical protein Tco_0704816 [Tanacetum coccineum]|uniref:No apical meristem-associated C-terminal domain-containing protein n=1 Tax=Tanacetum coccineum TaxID=301880 RepID=A0ABQ4Y3P7_9ASTR
MKDGSPNRAHFVEVALKRHAVWRNRVEPRRDYFNKALFYYEVEFGVPFTLRHLLRGLRPQSYNVWDQEVLKFLTNKNDAKRSKKFGSSSFNTKFGDASINLNVSARDDDEDDVHVLPLPIDRDKAKGLKKKVAGSSGSSSSMNDEALARLMLSELPTQNKTVMAMKKEECAAFLEIKRREVECREREIEMQEYRQ